MLSRCQTRRVLASVLLALWIVSVHPAPSQTPKPGAWEDDFKPGSVPGKRIFAASCAGCHGLDGRGGEQAPNIAGSARVLGLANAEIKAIVTNGIPGTGMPAFRSLAPAQVRAVVDYLRVLQGREKSQQVAGDAKNGKTVFFGNGECSSCHMVQGEGGFLGPDLSGYGSNRPAKEILKAILDPAANTEWRHKAATVVTKDGQTVNGLSRNEDNFSLQLQTADGTFHFFSKSDLQSLEYQDHPTMPTNYTERLSRSELDDLVNYLLSVGRKLRTDSGDNE
jgi:putative heme-binding domain-containing protein